MFCTHKCNWPILLAISAAVGLDLPGQQVQAQAPSTHGRFEVRPAGEGQPLQRRRALSQRFGSAFGNREELPSGSWGCPSPLRIHPESKVPTIVFWNEILVPPRLVYAVRVGWPDTVNGVPGQTMWRYYLIPLNDPSTGNPIDVLERPRISFTYDKENRPAIAIGVDDGGIRYTDQFDGEIYYGNILLITQGLQAEQWNMEVVPFGQDYAPVAGRLDYPDLFFTASGKPIVSAIGYHSRQDNIADDDPFVEELMLARKATSGWKVQRVSQQLCPPVTECSSGSRPKSPGLQWRIPTESDTNLLFLPDVEAAAHCTTTTPDSCSDPALRYIVAYPSLAAKSTTLTRLVFSSGERQIGAINYENKLYALDFKVSDFFIEADGPLPIASERLLNSNATFDFWQDFVYTGQSDSGRYILSLNEFEDPCQRVVVDHIQVYDTTLNQNPLSASAHPALDELFYDRYTAWKWWGPNTIAEIPDSTDYGYVTPRGRFGSGVIVDPSDEGASTSYFSSSSGPNCDNDCGLAGLNCQDAVSSVFELALESSLAFGVFPPTLESKAIIAFHAFELGGRIAIVAQNGPLPQNDTYGDFNFDLQINCDDREILLAAMNPDPLGWSTNLVCDYNADGRVNQEDEAAFESVGGPGPASCP